jgi:DNA-binding MarR family transcriptional regulator
MYDRDRFFTVTAHRIAGTPAGVEPRQTALDDLYLETFPPAPPRQPQLVTGASPGSASLEDTELIERARSARNGGKFAALWGGDLSGHAGDESAADLALLSMLAFWTSDEDQLDRVFRLSGLYRDKWERLDYRARTIARALERSQHYTAPVRPTVRPMPQDAASAPDGPVTADDLPDDLTALKLIVLDLRAEVAGLRDQVGDERRARLAAEERAERSARLRRQTTRALGNPHLAQERVTAVAVAYEMEANEAAGTPTDDDGFHRMPLARLAERAGTSTDTVSRHVKRLADLGALDRKVIAVTIDRETGEILSPPRLEQWVRPKTDADGFIESVATLVPAKPKPQWGGLKTCPDHPGAKIVKRTTVTCADCGRVLLEKSSDPMPHPATLADPPMPHLAASGDDAAVDEMPDPAGAGYRAAVDVTIGRKTPEWSAPPAQPAIPGSIAAEWLAGAKPHGEPGNDRWTNS